MRRIAWKSMLHDKVRLAGALAGVTFASMLIVLQGGVYSGFKVTSSGLVNRIGGDIWVMMRGAPALDFAETLSPGTRSLVLKHPCVESAWGVAMGYTRAQLPSGGVITIGLIGVEPRRDGQALPWSMAEGLPSDIQTAPRVTIDRSDFGKLEINQPPLASSLTMGGRRVRIAGVTDGIRSFTLVPYVFASLQTARRLLKLAPGAASFWVLDLASESCTEDVIRTIETRHGLRAFRSNELATLTEDYWINESGAGAVLVFCAVLGLLVGAVIVAQTLFTVVSEHVRELGTLKALGASSGEVIQFVLWQAALLGGVGGIAGALTASAIGAAAADALTIELSPEVYLRSAATIAGMCVVASIGSVRKVLRLEPAEVFK
jgi:putative ABC transport system permease protein